MPLSRGSVPLSLCLTLAALVVTAALGFALWSGRGVAANVGVITASVGIVITATAIRQLSGAAAGRILFGPRAAVVGGALLAVASLLCYTILLMPISPVPALAASVVLVQSAVRPLPSDAMITGALSVLPVMFFIWLIIAAASGDAVQAVVAGLALSINLATLAKLRQRSIAQSAEAPTRVAASAQRR